MLLDNNSNVGFVIPSLPGNPEGCVLSKSVFQGSRSGPLPSQVDNRHSDGANVLWVDGHVKWVKRYGLLAANAYAAQ